MKIEILSRYTSSVLYALQADSKKQAIETAVKSGADLRGAHLVGAYLDGADLGGAHLRGAYLDGAYLGGAHLRGAHLGGADLRGAHLRGAYLDGADLRGADLRGADLRGADLRGAYLDGADLRGADLGGAHLRGADLGGAHLGGAHLGGAYLDGAKGIYQIVPEAGAFVGFKKLANGVIAKIQIPEDAGRVSGYGGRKCRAEKAIVLEGEGPSTHDPNFIYAIGQVVVPNKWDPDPRVECSHGIHFFLTRQEAIDY